MLRYNDLRRSIAFILALLLAGCAVGPDYQRPSMDMPPSFRFEEKDARDTANTEWWKAFQDPVLDALIAEALANNRDVRIAAANVELAAGVLTQTRSPFFPQLSYTAAAARERVGLPSELDRLGSLENPRNSFEVLGGASWEIDLWGRIRRLSEAARADLLASREARRGVILSLVSTVAATYIQLRSLDDQLEIAQRTLSVYGESLRQFELQFKHGQVAQMNVEQARYQYETAASTIPAIKSQIVQTENALSILIGRNPGRIGRGKTTAQLAMPGVPAGLPSRLLERRPDITQAEQELVAANARIGAAKSLYFPSISLTGVLGSQSAELSDLFDGPSRTWSYAGSLTGPIFSGGAISGQVRQAEAGQKAALLLYENAVQNAFRDVEDSLVVHRETAVQLQSQGRLVDALREYDRLAWMQYNEGYAPYLNVLYAESQLFPAELDYSRTRTALLVSVVNIYKAMGGGWVNKAEMLAEPGKGIPERH